MRTLLVGLLVIAAAGMARAEDMQAYLQETRQLQKAGKHDEALLRHIWFHENALKHDRGMGGVRRSFALTEWNELAQVFPPALVALVSTRNATAQEIEKSGGTFDLFQDVAAIDCTLDQRANTVKLFAKISEKFPAKAKRYWIVAKDAVIGEKDYDLAKKHMGSAESEFEDLKTSHEMMMKALPKELLAKVKSSMERSFVDDTLQLIEVAKATGDEKGAEEVRKKAVEVVDDPRLQDENANEPAEEKATREN